MSHVLGHIDAVGGLLQWLLGEGIVDHGGLGGVYFDVGVGLQDFCHLDVGFVAFLIGRWSLVRITCKREFLVGYENKLEQRVDTYLI